MYAQVDVHVDILAMRQGSREHFWSAETNSHHTHFN